MSLLYWSINNSNSCFRCHKMLLAWIKDKQEEQQPARRHNPHMQTGCQESFRKKRFFYTTPSRRSSVTKTTTTQNLFPSAVSARSAVILLRRWCDNIKDGAVRVHTGGATLIPDMKVRHAGWLPHIPRLSGRGPLSQIPAQSALTHSSINNTHTCTVCSHTHKQVK